jgi:hypothetical protein
VLDSLPNYLLTAIKLPKKFYKDMDKLRRRFLWAGSQQLHGGKCKVSWTQVCQPLHRGGLGIVDLEHFRRALRLRWLWFQWKNPEKPWCGSVLPIDSVDESLFAAATRVQVHNRQTAKFWTSSWLGGVSLAAMFLSLYEHNKQKSRSVADALHNENWIWDLMHSVTTPIFAEYVLLWSMVDATGFNPSDPASDEIFWTRTTDGTYSAKSAYAMQFEGSLGSSFPATVWHIWTPSHCKVFVWLLLQRRIWTADRLMLREWPNQYFCPLCYRNLETSDHLFIECPWSRQLWLEISSWTVLPSLQPQCWTTTWGVPEWFNKLTGSSCSAKAKGLCSLIILVCWAIWRE